MEIVTKIAPIILALIMLGLGLGLKVEDFARVFKAPKDFIVGFISQLIILPIVAYLLIFILQTPPEIAMGVMIIAAAPGGVTSNILTKFADGDVALSISLTAIISLISIISVPFIIFTSADLLGITNISQNISMIGIAINGGSVSAMFGFFLCDGPVRNFDEAKTNDAELFGKLHREMLQRGIYLAPSPFEAGFTSLAHSEGEIDKTIEAFDQSFNAIKK